jgi:hypothetical protein
MNILVNNINIELDRIYCFCPLNINSDINEDIEIIDGVFLRKFTQIDKDLFNICVNKTFIINPISQSIECMSSGLFQRNSKMEKIIEQSKYNISFIDRYNYDKAKALDKAFRIIKLGSSALYYNFEVTPYSKTPNSSFGENDFIEPYFGEIGISEINLSDIARLKEITLKLLNNNNNKLDLILNKYAFSLSGIKIPNENRFLELMSILEMLYVPSKGSEITLRLSLRVSKMFEKLGIKLDESKLNESISEKYEKIKSLYGIRSQIVHSGISKNLTLEELKYLAEITRKSILFYLDEPDNFNDKNLTRLLYE